MCGEVTSHVIILMCIRYTPTAKPKRPFVLTRHESAESLLSAVYPYIVTISPNSHEPVVGAGALLLSEPNRYEQESAQHDTFSHLSW